MSEYDLDHTAGLLPDDANDDEPAYNAVAMRSTPAPIIASSLALGPLLRGGLEGRRR